MLPPPRGSRNEFAPSPHLCQIAAGKWTTDGGNRGGGAHPDATNTGYNYAQPFRVTCFPMPAAMRSLLRTNPRCAVWILVGIHLAFHATTIFFPDTGTVDAGDEFKLYLGISEVSLLTFWSAVGGGAMLRRVAIALAAMTMIVGFLSWSFVLYPRITPWTEYDWIAYFVNPGGSTLSNAYIKYLFRCWLSGQLIVAVFACWESALQTKILAPSRSRDLVSSHLRSLTSWR